MASPVGIIQVRKEVMKLSLRFNIEWLLDVTWFQLSEYVYLFLNILVNAWKFKRKMPKDSFFSKLDFLKSRKRGIEMTRRPAQLILVQLRKQPIPLLEDDRQFRLRIGLFHPPLVTFSTVFRVPW